MREKMGNPCNRSILFPIFYWTRQLHLTSAGLPLPCFQGEALPRFPIGGRPMLGLERAIIPPISWFEVVKLKPNDPVLTGLIYTAMRWLSSIVYYPEIDDSASSSLRIAKLSAAPWLFCGLLEILKLQEIHDWISKAGGKCPLQVINHPDSIT